MSRQIVEVMFVFAFLSLPLAVVGSLLFGAAYTALKGGRTRSACAASAESAASTTSSSTA